MPHLPGLLMRKALIYNTRVDVASVRTFSRLVSFLLLIMCSSLSSAHAAAIEGVTLGINAERTRLVLRFDNVPKYSLSPANDTVVVRLRGVDLSSDISKPKPSGALRVLRIEKQGNDTLLTIQTQKSQGLARHFILNDKGAPPRLVLDFSADSKSAQKPKKTTLATNNKTDDERFAENPAAPPRRKPIIVIDPGHGGDDPGAIGATGLKEKDVTLMTAREIKAALEQTGAYTVYLTRNDDRFIKLRDRTRIAQNYNADLFMSIHADAHTHPRANGTSVYTLSERASDKEAEALANKENRADIIHGVDLSNTTGEVSSILIDLVQRETMNLSAQYATMLVNNLKNNVNIKRDTHRFAGFMVLKAPDTPAILLELGFLSNPKEEWLLKQRSHRAKIVQAIVKTTNSFFRTAPRTRDVANE